MVYALKKSGSIEKIDQMLVTQAKCMGFSNVHIVDLISKLESSSMPTASPSASLPLSNISTLTAKYPAHTNYLYMTYNAFKHDIEFNEHCKTMILSSNITILAAVSSLIETVSTNFHETDRLHFKKLGYKHVMGIYELKQAQDVIVSMCGRLHQNIALHFKQKNVAVLGTNPKKIDGAGDRHKFLSILNSIVIGQLEWAEVSSIDTTKKFARKVR
ncbi:hypothetical protein OBBRIDRAFT_832914 [Obba rivulosa]|uniref:Carbamoyl phosphate synthase preATP-grasp domain-containing protein n=1 Tax=Obba rivulosa TaxID=1052685 RepID=A0A8E2B1Q7_9APHY|nr:hypothetical protein OBBRIDRAFT_832914 [Obba rivulosa]